MKEKREKGGKRAAAAVTAAVTAAGILAGGLFDAPADLLREDAAPPAAYMDGLLPDAAGDGGDQDGGQDDREKSRKRSLKAGLRECLLRLPPAVRLAVVLPLWLLGSAVLTAAGALWTAMAPLAQGLLGCLLRAALLLGIFLLAAKAAFPDLPLKKLLNWRRSSFLLLGAAALAAADRVLAAVRPEYVPARQAFAAVGCFAVLAAVLLPFAAREQRRRSFPPPAEKEPAPPPLPDKLTFIDPGGVFTVRTK